MKQIVWIKNGIEKIYCEISYDEEHYAGKSIIIVNGLYDSIYNSSINNIELTKNLIELGYKVYNFDYTCGDFKQGKSTGDIRQHNKYKMYEDLECVFNYANNLDSKIFIFAHSSGCLLSYELAERYPDLIKGMYWAAPEIDNVEGVLKYMLKHSPNFSKINFNKEQKKVFMYSFVENYKKFINYKNKLDIFIPEFEIQQRIEWVNQLGYGEKHYIKDADHLFNNEGVEKIMDYYRNKKSIHRIYVNKIYTKEKAYSELRKNNDDWIKNLRLSNNFHNKKIFEDIKSSCMEIPNPKNYNNYLNENKENDLLFENFMHHLCNNTEITTRVNEGCIEIVAYLLIKGVKKNIKELIKCILSRLFHIFNSSIVKKMDLPKIKCTLHEVLSHFFKITDIIKSFISSLSEKIYNMAKNKTEENFKDVILAKSKEKIDKVILYPARKACDKITCKFEEILLQ